MEKQGVWSDLVCAICSVPTGTLSGNPLAMTAGIKTLEILDRPGSYEYLDKITNRWVKVYSYLLWVSWHVIDEVAHGACGLSSHAGGCYIGASSAGMCYLAEGRSQVA